MSRRLRAPVLATLAAALVAVVAPTSLPAAGEADAVAAAASSTAVAEVRAPRFAARLETCRTGQDPDRRLAVVEATMPRRSDAARLAMRFTFERRAPGSERWARLAVPGTTRWIRSARDVRGLVHTMRVEGLPAPADVRAVVRFRWTAADGRLVRATRRTTRVCRQPDPRADLVVTAADATPDGVVVVVRNAGRGRTTAPVALELRAGGDLLAAGSVGALGGGGEARVVLPPVPCDPAAPPVVAVDPAGVVDEVDERSNARTVACVR